MTIEDLLRNKEFMARMVWIGYLASLVFIGIGLYVILTEIF